MSFTANETSRFSGLSREHTKTADWTARRTALFCVLACGTFWVLSAFILSRVV